MTDLVPNLPELARSLKDGSDASELVTAFSTDSLEQARAELQRIVRAWETPVDKKLSAGEAVS